MVSLFNVEFKKIKFLEMESKWWLLRAEGREKFEDVGQRVQSLREKMSRYTHSDYSAIWYYLLAEELMLLNCGVGEDS